ncbi:MAG: ChaN family lipoprotein, partial [Flavobacteriales bacterium]|nr:ChaN family lipoprotein [Flavobacteriales bacterium]
LFGELHNSPIAHWLQLAASKDLHGQRNLCLGAEMLEADDQQTLDRYLKGAIDRKALDSLARLWNNYATDYAPLVDFAKTNALPFIATNVPRRYASMVYKNGFDALDTLSTDEKAWIAPLPIVYDPELPGYKEMIAMMGGHGGDNLPKAQAIKDATMAHFILKNFKSDGLFLHFNGAYHSDRYEGILWYLLQARPSLKVVTISTVQQTDPRKLDREHHGKADFIICVDADVPGSY